MKDSTREPKVAHSRASGRSGRELERRTFMTGIALGASAWLVGCARSDADADLGRAPGVVLGDAETGEDVFAYVERRAGRFDLDLYRQVLGAANEYKEGDEAAGVAADSDGDRAVARRLLAATRISDLTARPVYEDDLSRYIAAAVDGEIAERVGGWTVGELRDFLLAEPPDAIEEILPGIHSDAAGLVVKLLSNEELIAVSRKLFHPLPGSNLGAEGYLAARIQPNSPTDDLDDIRWQVLDGWSYAVGDLLLGTNPVSSEVESVAAVEEALADLISTFGLEDVLPHCVLAHIDVQAEVERRFPGATALWFQSLAGVEDANRTFDISVEKMVAHAGARTGRYGLYFETGQGADGSNGHDKGFDMVLHEARKYGFARALRREVAAAQVGAGREPAPWVHVNDVAGFIGPEIFRTREQLVRCCLEDTVMGKLHGLTLGLDVCSTLHMSIDLDDLDWCLDRIMPANPAYLMALPTKNDPMLSYLTTGFQDHVRLREKFGLKVDDRMWRFFEELGVIDAAGRPSEHFGDPVWVYLQYRRRKGDERSEEEIVAEGRDALAAVRERGVFIAEGHGEEIWDLEPATEERLRYLYEDSKRCIFAELPEGFAATLPGAIAVATRSEDRHDYVLHPPTGEVLSEASVGAIQAVARARGNRHDVQIVVSDGLNPLSLTDDGHLAPYLEELRADLAAAGFDPAPEPIVVTSGRVRAGYRFGELLFGTEPGRSPRQRPAILHVIGERPGSGHHAFSVYVTAPPVATWARTGTADHNITRVVSGIADTALEPDAAAAETVEILREMVAG
ncbi:MAG: ethanolamine ammonia-lyase subunit EutB [Thermoanaerobaculia bacterium]|nr:ethanolamine ammonia-lyase subunit EutB [Thermoanaerobaculia bacterium]